MSIMVTPTVGRNVHLRRVNDPVGAQPLSAYIVYVHDDRKVNIAYFDADGTVRKAQRVQLRHGDGLDDQEAEYWVEFPVFVKQQAAAKAVVSKDAA